MKKITIGLLAISSASAGAMDCVGTIVLPGNNMRSVSIPGVESTQSTRTGERWEKV